MFLRFLFRLVVVGWVVKEMKGVGHVQSSKYPVTILGTQTFFFKI